MAYSLVTPIKGTVAYEVAVRNHRAAIAAGRAVVAQAEVAAPAAAKVPNFKAKLAEARALAMATGKVTTVAQAAGVAVVVQGKPIKAYTPRELQGNTAEDRAENNWTENDSVALAFQVEGDLDAQLDRDAKWFAGWYLEEHTAVCYSLGVAQRVARKHSTAAMPATIKRKSITVDFVSWTQQATEYIVTYKVKVCYACPGDADFIAPEADPVEFDEAGPAHFEAPVSNDPDFEAYPEWERVEYSSAPWVVVTRPHAHTSGCKVCSH